MSRHHCLNLLLATDLRCMPSDSYLDLRQVSMFSTWQSALGLQHVLLYVHSLAGVP